MPFAAVSDSAAGNALSKGVNDPVGGGGGGVVDGGGGGVGGGGGGGGVVPAAVTVVVTGMRQVVETPGPDCPMYTTPE